MNEHTLLIAETSYKEWNDRIDFFILKPMTDSKFDCLDTLTVYPSFQMPFFHKGLKMTEYFHFECSWLFLLIAIVDVVGVNHLSVFQDKENSNHFHFLSHFAKSIT